jgi:hypothetical protein
MKHNIEVAHFSLVHSLATSLRMLRASIELGRSTTNVVNMFRICLVL